MGLLLSGPWLAVAHARGAKPRIAVMAVSADQLTAEVRSKLDAALAGGLAASGADVVDSGTTVRRVEDKGLAGCQTSTCRVAIAEATGARYVMRASVESAGRSYTVRLEMIDGITGGVIGMREDRCEICTESDVYDTASMSASSLKSEVLKGDVRKHDKGEVDPPPGTKPVADLDHVVDPGGTDKGGLPPIVTRDDASGAQGAARGPRWRALSIVGVSAGAVAIGAGVFLLSINQYGTCNAGAGTLCEFRYRTRAGGITLISAGALAAVLGATFLIGRF